MTLQNECDWDTWEYEGAQEYSNPDEMNYTIRQGCQESDDKEAGLILLY